MHGGYCRVRRRQPNQLPYCCLTRERQSNSSACAQALVAAPQCCAKDLEHPFAVPAQRYRQPNIESRDAWLKCSEQLLYCHGAQTLEGFGRRLPGRLVAISEQPEQVG